MIHKHNNSASWFILLWAQGVLIKRHELLILNHSTLMSWWLKESFTDPLWVALAQTLHTGPGVLPDQCYRPSVHIKNSGKMYDRWITRVRKRKQIRERTKKLKHYLYISEIHSGSRLFQCSARWGCPILLTSGTTPGKHTQTPTENPHNTHTHNSLRMKSCAH